MTLLFAASEQESFTSVGGVTFSTNTDYYDSTKSNGAMLLDSADTLTADFTSSSDVWVHWLGFTNMASTANNEALILKSGSTELVRLRSVGGGTQTIFFEYWNGSSWVVIDTDVLPNITKQNIDIHCNFAASGEFTIFVDGTGVASFTGDTTVGGTAIDNAVFSGIHNANSHRISQIIVSTTSTLNWQLETILATSDGAATAWLGTFADIDEAGLNDDGTQINGQANGDEELFVFEDPTTPTNYVINSLVWASRSSIGSTGPQNMQFLTRSGSTNYPSSSVSGIDLGLKPFQLIQTLDPDTSLAWDDTSVAAVQGGLKAIT